MTISVLLLQSLNFYIILLANFYVGTGFYSTLDNSIFHSS